MLKHQYQAKAVPMRNGNCAQITLRGSTFIATHTAPMCRQGIRQVLKLGHEHVGTSRTFTGITTLWIAEGNTELEDMAWTAQFASSICLHAYRKI
jgi:hypothetical protein